MSSRIGRRVVVTGRVQGVGFRFHTVSEAERRGVDGWVRNRLDGTVEAELSGRVDAVEGLLAWLRQGPPSARVEQVDIEKIEPSTDSGFSIR